MTLPPLKQILSSSSASLNDPTPGLTPNSSLGSTPATSISIGGDDNLAKSSNRGSQHALGELRHIQPKPPEPPFNTLENYASGHPAGPSTALPDNSLNEVPSLEELPEWPPSAMFDFQVDEIAEFPQLQNSDFVIPASGVSNEFNIVDPTALNAFNNFIDMNAFGGLDNGMSAAYPDLPDDFDPFANLANNDPAFPVGQPSFDPLMPSILLNHDGVAMRRFDDRPYTGNLGADNMISPTGLFPQAAPTVVSTLHGEGSRRNTARDDELVKLRAQGLSYRDIKQRFAFDVAESTLRGRMRSLMKRKEDRVRKPSWKPENVSSALLRHQSANHV